MGIEGNAFMILILSLLLRDLKIYHLRDGQFDDYSRQGPNLPQCVMTL